MKIKLQQRQLQQFLLGILIIPTVIVGGISFLFITDNDDKNTATVKNQKEQSVRNDCMPAFRDGGGPYYKANSPFRENIAPDENDGEKLIVEGYILDSDCSDPVPNAVLDIWQANESGEYEDEYYRGKVKTDKDGYYRFETVVPLGYGEGTAYRPPHIHFKVFVDDKEIVTSQMFFKDVKGRAGFEDEYIISVTDKGDELAGKHDIALPDFEI